MPKLYGQWYFTWPGLNKTNNFIKIFWCKIIVHLQENRPQFFLKIGCVIKVIINDFLYTIQPFPMTDFLVQFWKKLKSAWRFIVPTGKLVGRKNSIKSSVQFNGIKLTGIINQFVFGASGIKSF